MSISVLPTELVVHVLSHLPLIDLLTCQLINKHIRNTIQRSILLQYSIATATAGVTDNPCCPLSISERLEALRKKQHAWGSFTIGFRVPISVQGPPSGIYELTGGIFLLGNAALIDQRVTTSVNYLRLPSSPQLSRWSCISVHRHIVDVGLSVYEHNLIAIVTYSENEAFLGMSLDVCFLNIYTGTPHHAAADPVLHITDLSMDTGRCMISIAIVGDMLALLVIFPFASDATEDRIYIIDWKKGKLAASLAVPHDTYCDLIFLSDDIILLANRYTESLDIFRIPTSYTGSCVPLTISLALYLPILAPSREIMRIVCHCEPNPVGRHSHQSTAIVRNTAPFENSAQDAIVLFNIYIDQVNHGGSSSFVVHRRALLALLHQSMVTTKNCLLWSQWGPPVTRWFNTDRISTRWITTTHGQRLVFIAQDKHICLFDFNPYHVRQFKPPASEPPFADIAAVTRATRDVEHSYVEPVLGSLPYVICSTKGSFDFDAVLLDEERIIGMRYKEPSGSVKDIEVLHFG